MGNKQYLPSLTKGAVDLLIFFLFSYFVFQLTEVLSTNGVFLSDIFLTFNIAISLAIFLHTYIYVGRSFSRAIFIKLASGFVSFRLLLNFILTIVILAEGHADQSDAGNVVMIFGEIMTRDNIGIGLVILLIFITVNFVFTYKNGGKILGIAVRYALVKGLEQGKVVDSDLSAGIIDQEQARNYRQKIQSKFDFFGSIYERDEFVFSIDNGFTVLIVLINIIGGVALGLFLHELTFEQTVDIYVPLAVGLGIAMQVPNLFLSAASLMLATSSYEDNELSEQTQDKLGIKLIIITFFISCVLVLMLELPYLYLGFFTGALAAISYSNLFLDENEIPDDKRIDIVSVAGQ